MKNAKNRHRNYLRLETMTLGDIQQLLYTFRSELATNDERNENFRRYTIALFEIALFRKDESGNEYAKDMDFRTVMSIIRSLQLFRIYNQKCHDKIYEIALKIIPNEPL